MKAPEAAPAVAPAVTREAGVVLWDRLRLEKPIEVVTGKETWSAVDLPTGALHLLEFPRADSLPAKTDAALLLAGFRACIPPRHPGLLPFYRVEGAWPGAAFVSGHRTDLSGTRSLKDTDVSAIDPSRLLDRIQSLAHIVQELETAGARAHGGIAPSRLALLGEEKILLTGYPHAAYFDSPTGNAFVSPARRGHSAPVAGDDVFSLGAIAWFLLTGGSTPPVFTSSPAPDASIARERARKNLPPLPASWPSGWDDSIYAALQEDSSRRPASARAFIDAINGRTGRRHLDAVLRASPLPPAREQDRPRRSPIGRLYTSTSPRRQSRIAADTETSGSPGDALQESPLHALAKIRAERSDLSHARSEIERRETDVAKRVADTDQRQAHLARETARLQSEQSQLESARKELAVARDQLTKAQQQLASDLQQLSSDRQQHASAQQQLASAQQQLSTAQQQLTAGQKQLTSDQQQHAAAIQQLNASRQSLTADQAQLAAQRRDLDNEIAEHRREQERLLAEATASRDALRTDAAKLAQTDQEAAAQARALESEKTRLLKERDQFAKAERDLKTKLAEFATRERALAELQQSLERISGGTGVDHWRNFIQQLEASRRDLQQRAAQPASPARRELAAQAVSPSEISASSDSSLPAPPPPQPPAPPPAAPASSVASPGASSSSSAAAPPVSPPPETREAPVTQPPLPSTPASDPQVVAPPPAPDVRKLTLAFTNGRRLHVFAGPTLRFGRHGNSDVLLVALLAGQAQPSLALNREISRKHFELQVGPEGMRILDGWSDDGKPSQHGVCLDGRRVPPSGAVVRHGMLLSVTTRAPSRSVPHWKVQMAARAAPESVEENFEAAAGPSLSYVHLQRLDEAPDDLLAVLDSASLHNLGISVKGNPAIVRTPTGFAWRVGPETLPIVQGPTPFEEISVLSLGWTSPSISVATS